MTKRDFQQQVDTHDARQAKADGKIKDQGDRMRAGHAASEKQKADDQKLMNEMRGNKASLDFNRAMFDYDEEHKDEKRRARDDIPSEKSDFDSKP